MGAGNKLNNIWYSLKACWSRSCCSWCWSKPRDSWIICSQARLSSMGYWTTRKKFNKSNFYNQIYVYNCIRFIINDKKVSYSIFSIFYIFIKMYRSASKSGLLDRFTFVQNGIDGERRAAVMGIHGKNNGRSYVKLEGN